MTRPPAEFDTPVVATYGESGAEAPLVVLLHGRGSNEQDIISLASHLPSGVAYTAVRAPIAEGGGYAWFANRGIGRPLADSLAETMAWFRGWLDEVAPPGRPVVLAGFSGGAAFAGGLVLSDPARFSGAAVLFGTLPFEAGVPTETGQLTHLPIFLAHGDQDQVIPAELLERTWRYLNEASGAPVVARRSPGGHGVTASVVADLGDWIAERLTYMQTLPTPAPGRPAPVTWPTIPGGVLARRGGAAPDVTWAIPQQQLSQNAPPCLQERLLDLARELPGVTVGASRISVPGARALNLADGAGESQAFLVPSSREFAHLHPSDDGSLHLALPAAHAGDLVAKGWGRTHPLAGTRLTPGFVMVFGPRDEEDLATVTSIVTLSHAYASGLLAHEAAPGR
jgi:phospholipase/carboxylesterase